MHHHCGEPDSPALFLASKPSSGLPLLLADREFSDDLHSPVTN